MKTYLVTDINHRVDGTSIVRCIEKDNQRSLTLKLIGRPHLPPMLAGAAYNLTWKYHLGRKEILTATPISIPSKLWPHMVSKGFYADDLKLPNKVKSTLLNIDKETTKKLADSLPKQILGLFEEYLPEPYMSILKFHCNRFRDFQDAMTSMMSAGISQQSSEAIYSYYGADFSEIIKTPTKLMEFQASDETTKNKKCRLLNWLNHEANYGSTIINYSDIPAEFSGAVNWCKQNKLIIEGLGKVQLTSHAIQQRLLRIEIQRICRGFTPKYANSEIDYAYSRYSGLMGIYYEQNFPEAVSTSINSRFSYISAESVNITNQYINEVSAILQILGNPPPLLIIRNQTNGHHYSNADADLNFLNDLPHSDSGYRTIIIPDLHHYTIGAYHLLFKKLTERDRIIAISNLATATDFNVGSQIAKQLATYFPSASITNATHPATLIKIDTLPLDIPKIVSDLNNKRALVAVCDHPDIIKKLNNISRQQSQETVFISGSSVFRRTDKIIIHPPALQPESSFFCRLISTNDNGVYADSTDGHMRIPSSLLNNSSVSLGFAMTPEMACSIGIKEAVLVCRSSHKDGILRLLLDHKVTVERCFTYSDTELPYERHSSIQRITPTIE